MIDKEKHRIANKKYYTSHKEQYKKHIETQFKNGMNWNNYGVHGWHIDHIKPCSSFDLSNTEEQKKCFNYKNLQPLLAIDNIKKSNKMAEV